MATPTQDKHVQEGPYSFTSNLSSNSLCSDPSDSIPPKVSVIGINAHSKMAWKNGSGETTQVAIYPETSNFASDPFIWRLSLAQVHDSCSFSLFPGYDIILLLLPESAAKTQIKGSLNATAILHHNDQVKSVPLKCMVPYTYQGEWPTTCSLNVSPLRHLTFISNRKLAKVTCTLHTVASHGDLDDHMAELVIASPNDASSDVSSTKLLLGHFTIVYVISGRVQVEIEGHVDDKELGPGETLMCERDEDSSPTHLKMSCLSDREPLDSSGLERFRRSW